MADITVIFVSPKYSGNVGSLARVMKNFGFKNLILVDPKCEIDDESFKFAMHGQDVLENARIVNDLNILKNEFNLLIGTSAISTKSEKHFLRIPKTPREIAKFLKKYKGKVGIVFGREDIGLLNNELEMMDMFVTIPASEEYPVMNITHAASIILYEIFLAGYSKRERILAGGNEIEILYKNIVEIIDLIDYPEHKKKNTEIMIKRIIGRAGLTSWEYHILMGVVKGVKDKLSQHP